MSTSSVQRVAVPVAEWHGDYDEVLTFPDDWDVQECRMKGHDAAALDDEAIGALLASPVGTAPLRALAAGKRQVVILFDDLDRPTPVARVVPLVLEQLHAGGIEDEQIRFVSAPGSHRLLSLEEVSLKLGAEVCRRYPFYNHNLFDHVVEVGRTSLGTPVWIGREVMACDLKIGIGGLIPYHSTGHVFGGGAKIVLPGVSGKETIDHHHLEVSQMPPVGEVSAERANAEEAARIVGLDFKVDLLINARREVVDLVAGCPIEGYRAGCRRGRDVYETAVAEGVDVVVVNAYPQATQPYKGLWCVQPSVRDGGDVVVLAHRPEGMQQLRFMFADFGSDGLAELRGARHRPMCPQVRQVTVLCPYPSKVDIDRFVPARETVFCTSWDQVLGQLQPHHGPGTRAAVYACAPIQMPAARA